MLQWGDTSAMGPLWTRLWAYGGPGSGKTLLASQFPQPFFGFVHNENSEVTLRGMLTSGMPIRYVKFGVPPQGSRADSIIPVRKDIEDLVNFMLVSRDDGTLYQKFGYTFVIDNMTHLNDLVVAEISDMVLSRDDKKGQMHKQKWGLLRNFYLHLRDVLWQLPMHIIFISHATVHKDALNNVTFAGPALQGQGADLLPSSCDALGFCEQDPQGNRLVHFQKFGNYPARHRYAGVAPGPFPNLSLWHYIAPGLGHG